MIDVFQSPNLKITIESTCIVEATLWWRSGLEFFHKRMESTTKTLVKEYYKISTDFIPTIREKSEWQADNKCGFFLGILEKGLVPHVRKLHTLLESRQFKEQEKRFMEEMYQFYIYPFKQHTGSCHTPDSSRPSSTKNSAEDLDYIPEGGERVDASGFEKGCSQKRRCVFVLLEHD